MKAYHHFIIFLICLITLLYDWSNYIGKNNPYSIFFFIAIIIIGYWNLVLSITKSLRDN